MRPGSECYVDPVTNLLIGLVAAALSTNPPAAVSNLITQKTGLAVKVNKPAIDENDPVEKEFQKLLELDDAAQDEVDKWIKDAKAFEAQGAPVPQATLNARIDQRFAEVRKAYDHFLLQHPKHARARLAYGSFLYEIQEEEDGVAQWEKARELDASNPAAWNNLANHYGHRGPVKKAFQYYAKAIELNPTEPVYLQNLATTVYLFRHDAKEYYDINEEQVFNKALALYRQALKLDPKNFPLATDFAQSYYGIKPLRAEEALEAWEYALKVANDDIEREGVFLHMARVELNCGRFEQARRHLSIVTNAMYNTLKARLTRNLTEKETKGKEGSTSAAAAKPATPQTLDQQQTISTPVTESK